MAKNHKNVVKVAVSVLSLIIILIITVLIFMIINSKETYTSDNDNKISTESIYCYSSSIDAPFFRSAYANTETHEIKVIFDDGLADKITYTYKGTFSNNKDAEQMNADSQARYNIYMGSDGDKLSATFNVIENTYNVVVYGKAANFDNKIAAIFYLDNLSKKLDKYSSDELMRLYKEKGFKCNN